MYIYIYTTCPKSYKILLKYKYIRARAIKTQTQSHYTFSFFATRNSLNNQLHIYCMDPTSSRMVRIHQSDFLETNKRYDPEDFWNNFRNLQKNCKHRHWYLICWLLLMWDKRPTYPAVKASTSSIITGPNKKHTLRRVTELMETPTLEPFFRGALRGSL